MDWKKLENLAQLSEILSESYVKPQLVFKHSTRCGVSLHVLDTLESEGEKLNQSLDTHYLDLLSYRNISDAIASDWGVFHQSPQVIVIENSKVIHHATHYTISAAKILQSLSVH